MTNMESVCRAITFYNNYIPSVQHDVEWDYLAFGTVDGIDVGKNFIEGKSEPLMELIWEEQKRFTKTVGIEFIAQQTYIVYSGDVDKEKDFWEGADYPFFFFCRIQCCGNTLQALTDKSVIEDRLAIDGKTKACIYLTYDNTDLFLILRAKRYDVGASVINYLHSPVNLVKDRGNSCCLKSSFTVFAVSQSWLKSADLTELNNQKIDKLYLKVIEKTDGKFQQIASDLKKNGEKVEAGAVLGVDDGMIFMEDVEIGDFLSMYISDKGALCYKNTSEVVSNVTTGIVLTKDHLEDALKELELQMDEFCDFPQDSEWQKAYISMVGNMKKNLDIMEENPDNMKKDLDNVKQGCKYKELHTILNVIPKFEGKLFNDYLIFPLLKPIDLLIRMLNRQKAFETDNEYFYDFIKSFSMYVQSAVITDRHATQMMDFNKKIYDIPIKINAFYNAYLDYVKNALTIQNGNDYVFFVMPGMNSIVNVMELYPDIYADESERKRLIKVEIPEASAYEMTNMMIILAHESAHYVGGNIYRNRDKRYEAFLKSCAHIYVRYVQSLNCQHAFISEKVQISVWKEIEQRVYGYLYDKLSKRETYEYWDKILIPDESDECKKACKEEFRKKKLYTSMMRGTIEQTFQSIEWEEMEGIFYPIIYRMEQEEQRKTMEGIRQATDRFVAYHNQGTIRVTINTVLHVLVQLYEEVFADMISVLTLNISVDEYVKNILKNVEEQGMEKEELISSDGLVRVAAVIAVMIGLDTVFPDISAAWTQKLRNIGRPESDWEQVAGQALILWTDCIKNKNENESDESYEKNVLYALQDRIVLSELVKYLNICANDFKEVCGNDAESFERLRNMYHRFADTSSETAEEQVRIIVEFVEEYRIRVSKEWTSLAKKTIE